jgi:lipopolysaccharide transport system ATP-binding protein
MAEDTLIQVEGVSKKFCRDLKRSLWYGVQDLGNELRGRTHAHLDELRPEEFWALRDINFEVKRGECIGLLGRNGAGKSTLLKVLTGLIKPDAGRALTRGRVGALIELGGGFNPILSGRENIYIGGAVLGFSQAEIKKKLDAIIAFSELEEFIDMPVQNYSSGMKVRLGFSVAVNLEPDVLFLDEVLAVGDAGFRIKSYNKMSELLSRCAVVFVSHSMTVVARVCTDVALLKNGHILYSGNDVASGIEQYLDMFENGPGKIEFEGHAQLKGVRMFSRDVDSNDGGVPRFRYADDIFIEMEATVDSEYPTFQLSFSIVDKDMKPVAQYRSAHFQQFFSNAGRPMKIQIEIPNCLLTNGEYFVNFALGSGIDLDDNGTDLSETLARYRNWARFKVTGFRGSQWAPFALGCRVEVQGV